MAITPSVLFTLGLLAGLTPFAIDLYLPSIPTIARDLGASVEMAQLSLTVYLGVFAVGQLFLGPVSDVLGRRRTIQGGLAVFFLASLACVAVPSMEWMLAARAVQAAGGAAVAVTVPALVRDLFDKDEYARVMGLVMIVMAMAPLVAPMLGSAIVATAHWRWVFVALAAITTAAAVLFQARVPETLAAARRQRFDLGQISRNYLRLLTHAAGLGYMLTGGLAFAGMMTFIVSSPYVYMELYHVPARYYGFLFSLHILAAVLAGFVNTRIVRRLGAERLLRFGLGVQATAALLLLGLALGGEPPLWVVAGASMLFIGTNGLVLGNSLAGFMAYFPQLAGTASAFAGTLRFGLGALIGTVVSLVHDGTAAPMQVAMGLCGLLAVTVYLLLCLPAQRRQARAGA